MMYHHPADGSWILLVEDLVAVANANEDLLAILFRQRDGAVEQVMAVVLELVFNREARRER